MTGKKLTWALAVLATVDILSTALCLAGGASEGNPLVTGLFPVFGTLGTLLMLYTGLKLPLAWAMGRTFDRLVREGHGRKAHVFAVASLSVMGLVVLNNSVALFILWRS